MATINQLRSRLTALNVKDVSYHSVEETKEVIEEIQREQMYSGFLSTGLQTSPLHGRYPGYADYTIAVKRAKGQVFDRVTLKDEGQFYAGIKTSVTAESFKTISTDIKSLSLTSYYGEDIFGLNKESKSEYAGKLRPVFIKNVKEKLKL